MVNLTELKRLHAEMATLEAENAGLMAALITSEQRFDDIAYAVADWIWEVDKSVTYIYCSEKVQDILGYTPEEVIGKSPYDFMLRDEAIRVKKIVKKLIAKREPIIDLENWNLTKTGEKVCLLTNGIPIFGKNGSVVGYRGVDKNITLLKENGYGII